MSFVLDEDELVYGKREHIVASANGLGSLLSGVWLCEHGCALKSAPVRSR